MRYVVGVPYGCSTDIRSQNTTIYLLKEVSFTQNRHSGPWIVPILTMHNSKRLTEEGCLLCYKKWRRNLIYKVLKSTTYVNSKGLVTHTDQHIIFEKGDLRHTSRRVELWSKNKKKSAVLLTNNFELSVEDIEENLQAEMGLLKRYTNSSNRTFRYISSMVTVSMP